MSKHEHDTVEISCLQSSDATLIEVSDGFCSLLSQPRDQLIGRWAYELLHPDDVASVEAACASSRRLGTALVRYRVLTAPGHYRAVQAYFEIVDDGRFAEPVMRSTYQPESRPESLVVPGAVDWFDRIFTHTPLGVALVGMNGRFQRVNPALTNLLGYPVEELLAMEPDLLAHPADAVGTIDHFAGVVFGAARAQRRGEKRYVGADGRVIWVQTSVSVIDDAAEDTMNFLLFVTDITDLKSAPGVAQAPDGAPTFAGVAGLGAR